MGFEKKIAALNWTVLLFVVSQAVASLLWAGKMSEKVDWIKTSVGKIEAQQAIFVSNEDAAKIEARVERLENYLWSKKK